VLAIASNGALSDALLAPERRGSGRVVPDTLAIAAGREGLAHTGRRQCRLVARPWLLGFGASWNAAMPNGDRSGRPRPSLRPGVTAIAAYNDEVALTLLTAAHLEGLRVPQDLAIIGVDDIRAGRLVDPQLTTVQLAPEAEARYLAGCILSETDQEVAEGDPPTSSASSYEDRRRRGVATTTTPRPHCHIRSANRSNDAEATAHHRHGCEERGRRSIRDRPRAVVADPGNRRRYRRSLR
jgi:hypothetical protein